MVLEIRENSKNGTRKTGVVQDSQMASENQDRTQVHYVNGLRSERPTTPKGRRTGAGAENFWAERRGSPGNRKKMETPFKSKPAIAHPEVAAHESSGDCYR